MGFLEAAFAHPGGAGESACLVPEQFGLDQRFGKGRAVHGNERLLPPVGQAVEAFGDQLLARPALADDEHRPAQRRSAAGAFDRIEECARLADELIIPLHDHNIAKFPKAWQ